MSLVVDCPKWLFAIRCRDHVVLKTTASNFSLSVFLCTGVSYELSVLSCQKTLLLQWKIDQAAAAVKTLSWFDLQVVFRFLKKLTWGLHDIVQTFTRLDRFITFNYSLAAEWSKSTPPRQFAVEAPGGSWYIVACLLLTLVQPSVHEAILRSVNSQDIILAAIVITQPRPLPTAVPEHRTDDGVSSLLRRRLLRRSFAMLEASVLD